MNVKKLIWILSGCLIVASLFCIPRLFKPWDVYRIPVSFSKTEEPQIKVGIEGNSYLFNLDTGSANDFTMHSDLLEKIKRKRFLGTAPLVDCKGNPYTSSVFSWEEKNLPSTPVLQPLFSESLLSYLRQKISTKSK